jgi:hypothetical protein
MGEVVAELWHDIRSILKKHPTFYRLLGGGVLILVGILIGRATYPGQEWAFGMSLTTEIIGIVLTVSVIEWFNRRRALHYYQQKFVDDAGSLSNEVAKNAVHHLRSKGWLEGKKGLLCRADLGAANLQGVELWHANLHGASLWMANLQGATLMGANLERAWLLHANLQAADLSGANLHGADLRDVSFQGARSVGAVLQATNMEGAHLQGTDLSWANLRGANLSRAEFDQNTKLPDQSHWTSNTDLHRFIDPEHPEFWNSPLTKEAYEQLQLDRLKRSSTRGE